jgi:hypothetical protein
VWPEEFALGVIKPLHKKGDRENCANYRGITLLSVTGKVLLGAIASRIAYKLEEDNFFSEAQCGFRDFRGCVQQVFTLYSILATRKANNQGTLACFLDLEKAYDVVWRKALLVKLAKAGITGKIWKLLDSTFCSVVRVMHKDTTGSSKHHFSAKFNIDDFGLPQGSPESCVNFNVYVNDLAKELTSKGFGVMVNQIRIACLLVTS